MDPAVLESSCVLSGYSCFPAKVARTNPYISLSFLSVLSSLILVPHPRPSLSRNVPPQATSFGHGELRMVAAGPDQPKCTEISLFPQPYDVVNCEYGFLDYIAGVAMPSEH